MKENERESAGGSALYTNTRIHTNSLKDTQKVGPDLLHAVRNAWLSPPLGSTGVYHPSKTSLNPIITTLQDYMKKERKQI